MLRRLLLFITIFLILFGASLAAEWISWSLTKNDPFEQFALLNVMVRPWGMIVVAALCLGLEWLILGFENSSFAQLTKFNDPSVKTDWFCFVFLSLLGLRPVFGLVFSLGATYYIQKYATGHLNFAILAGQPAWLQFGALLFLNPLLFYAVHRIMHWRLWEIHRVHHSATSMTILTPHRNHPIDFVVVTLINTVPAALLGADFLVIGAYEFLNGVYQSLVHSNLSWNSAWIDRYLLISPEAHRLHHSNNPAHFNKNFGILVVWERLFGTHLRPDMAQEHFTIGFQDGDLHNSGKPLREIFYVARKWWSSL